MHPKQFLVGGGWVLVLIGILGFAGLIGPTAEASIFGANWWFDVYENWTHLILGIVALLAAYILPASIQKPLVVLVGLLALFFTIWSGFVSTDFYGAMLENPADTILHLVVGVWALLAGLRTQPAMGM